MACCCLYRRKDSIDEEDLSLSSGFGPDGSASRHGWWQEGWQLLASRRPPSSERDGSRDDEPHYEAPKWKQFLRKVRAESRKLNCWPHSHRFTYDPLSYAMNFDEGCWQSDLYGQGYLHSMRFSAPMVLESERFREAMDKPDFRAEKTVRTSLPLPHSEGLSVWQRRKACKPPAVDLKLLRTRWSAGPAF